jgi:thymidylate synthase
MPGSKKQLRRVALVPVNSNSTEPSAVTATTSVSGNITSIGETPLRYLRQMGLPPAGIREEDDVTNSGEVLVLEDFYPPSTSGKRYFDGWRADRRRPYCKFTKTEDCGVMPFISTLFGGAVVFTNPRDVVLPPGVLHCVNSYLNMTMSKGSWMDIRPTIALSWLGVQMIPLVMSPDTYPVAVQFMLYNATPVPVQINTGLHLAQGLLHQTVVPRILDSSVEIVSFPKANSWEQQYWNIVREIFKNGTERSDTNHGGCKAIFKPADIVVDLKDGICFPLLKCRPVAFKTMVKELLWFLTGSTSSKDLEAVNCNIWKGNSSREYLDSRGLHAYPEGEVGPMYGFQWRHYGADFVQGETPVGGVDQIAQLVTRLRAKPNDRGHVLLGYNPTQKHQQCVTSCHVYSQFFVENGKLNCAMVQRSVDVALGLPFNISSYSLLTIMLARILGLEAGKYYHTCMDTHIYSEHSAQMREYLERADLYHSTNNVDYPSIHVPSKYSIDDFKLDDFKLNYYCPLHTLGDKMNMTV